MKVTTLKKRNDFLAIAAKGNSVSAQSIVLQVKSRADMEEGVRVGLTVTKKVGKAVERNRIKRKLRCITREIMPAMAQPGYDYVVIARRSALRQPYDTLKRDIIHALTSVGPK